MFPPAGVCYALSMKFEVLEATGRLDQFLSIKTARSRSFVKYQILHGNVSVNGSKALKPSQWLKEADVVSCAFVENEKIELTPVPMELEVLYEDNEVIVINKSQGWIVHPATSHRGDTVVHYLLHHLNNREEFREISPTRPGIVHRLDRGTSGCLVVAKNRKALENLSSQFKDRTVEKEYEAIVWGKTKTRGTISTPVGRHLTHRKKMSSKTRDGRDALTRWEAKESFDQFTWVRLMPKTGRTHQLRVHLSEMANPIVGDKLYGRKRDLTRLDPQVAAFLKARAVFPFLHARAIRFAHPTTGKPISLEAKAPENFTSFLTLLRQP